ncbi:MAG: DUF424 family protein [Nanoarchaeota archaeon]|nr:DUF424 family protein [Nanoarchaeota archaeon]MBU1501517.1 DUF424 family protein [Nanoarchaeota archaeon]
MQKDQDVCYDVKRQRRKSNRIWRSRERLLIVFLFKMFVNVIKSYRDVVAVCDKELLGKKFEEPVPAGVRGLVRQLDVKENFYKNSENPEPMTEESVRKIMEKMQEEDATFNLIGKKSVKVALELGIITEENVGKIQGIPFALVLL